MKYNLYILLIIINRWRFIMKKFLILILVSSAIFAEPSFYDLVNSANTAPSNSQASSAGWLSNLFAENPAYQSQSPKYLELVKTWFNPQSDTAVTEVIEEPFVSPKKTQASNSSWWSNLFAEKPVVAEKPGFFARMANRLLGQDSSSTTNYGALAQMLMGGKSNNQPTDSLFANYLEFAKNLVY